MNIEQVNAICTDISQSMYEDMAQEMLEMLQEDELAAMMYEHDMQMYACHSYDNDCTEYGMMQ
jgi:hypothetical protein